MTEDRLKEIEGFAYSMTHKKAGEAIEELIAEVRSLRTVLDSVMRRSAICTQDGLPHDVLKIMHEENYHEAREALEGK